MKSWLSFPFAITSEVSIGIFMLLICAANLICYLSRFGDLAIQNHTCAARLPPLMSQRLLPWRHNWQHFWPGWTPGRCCGHFHTNPGAPSGPGGPFSQALHLQISPMPHATCVHHDATKVHCGKLCLLPIIGFGYFKLTLISETSPVREAWPYDSGGSSSPWLNPQAGRKLRHWTTSPGASAPVDKHRARQQYGKCCWTQLLHHLCKTYCFNACTRPSHILSQSSSHLGKGQLLVNSFHWLNNRVFSSSFSRISVTGCREVHGLLLPLKSAYPHPETALNAGGIHKPSKAMPSEISLAFVRMSPAIPLAVQANVSFGIIQVNIWTEISVQNLLLAELIMPWLCSDLGPARCFCSHRIPTAAKSAKV